MPVPSLRRYCQTNPEKPAGSHSTRPQHHLSYVDKLTLRVFGNLKGTIPNEVSYAVMEKAESKRRITTNLLLVALCAFGSMYMVYTVKKGLKNKTEGGIYDRNLKRYAKADKTDI